MLTAILAKLAGSKIGRYVASFLALAAATTIIVLKLMAAGAAKERAKQNAQRLKNVSKKVKSDAEIDSLSPSDRRKRLAEWMQPDE